MFSSTIQILKVNDVATGVSKKTGLPWERHTAETILLDDDGQLLEVGKLAIPKDMRGNLKPGVYRAGFTLGVVISDSDRGNIVTRLTSLVPVPTKNAPAPSQPPTPKA